MVVCTYEGNDKKVLVIELDPIITREKKIKPRLRKYSLSHIKTKHELLSLLTTGYLLVCAPARLWETFSVLVEVSAAPNSLAQRSPPWHGLSAWTQVGAFGVSLSFSPLLSSCLLSILIWDQVSALFWQQSSPSTTPSIRPGHHSGIVANSGLLLACIPAQSCLAQLWELRNSWWCRPFWCETSACWLLWLLSTFLSAWSSGQLVTKRAEHGGGGETQCSSEHSCLLCNSRGSRSKLRSKGNTESGCSRSSSSWNKGWHWPSDMDRNPQEW